MSFDPEDPKWTAYVLNELSPAERITVEQELASSPEARALVTELRETTRLLEGELQAEPTITLSSDQRTAIANHSESKVTLVRAVKAQRQYRYVGWAAAAMFLLTIGALLLPGTQSARQSARLRESANKLDPIGRRMHQQHDVSSSDVARQGQSQPYPEAHGTGDDAVHVITEDISGEDNSKLVTREVPEPPNLPGLKGALSEGLADNQRESSPVDHSVKNPNPHDQSSQNKARSFATIDLKPVPPGKRWNRKVSGISPIDTLGRQGGSQKSRPFDSGNGQIVGPEQLSEIIPAATDRYASSGELLGKGFDQPNRTPETLDEWRQNHPLTSEVQPGSETYNPVTDNPFFPARENPLSTFSIDVDTASYSNIRRFLMQNCVLPPKDAVRIEELINYFRYDYPQPEGDVPFSVTTEVAGCPWNTGHRLVRVGLKGREIETKKRPPSNLVFLLDVSGSMTDANKLPLVREAMKLLVEQLTENDRVAIVVYAGNSGLVLPSTTGDKQREIREAIDRLQAGGSTNGAGGIQHAYEIASGNFIKGGTNRVILATDGDFNVGITNRDGLFKLITEQAKSGVFLTTLGFGMGNLKDGTLEQLADKGNGNYAYIDDMREAKKVFVEQMNGTLVTIANDVKIQIEFNPVEVASYRLIGYENRVLAHEDFNDDKKDAGEIGAGHTVTALYEIAPTGERATEGERPAVDPLKYQKPANVANNKSGEMLTLKLRYKQPDGDTSKLIEKSIVDDRQPYGRATADFKFASSVALFGMILRDSPHKGTGTIDAAEELAREGLSKDDGGYRTEFIELIKQAEQLLAR